MTASIALLWLACAIETAGTTFAYFQGEYPSIADKHYRNDMGEAWLFGLVFGPLGSLMTIFLSGFWKHGWRLR